MQFEVDRTDASRTRIVAEPHRDLAPGEARLAIERFGLSANNISYHALGDLMGYWLLFPSHEAEVGWRRIPVWGLATVVASTHDHVPVGRRYFGMYPMGDELIVRPTKVDGTSFHDATAHRQDVMATVWNQYSTLPGDEDSSEPTRSWDVLLRPLCITGYLVSDHLGQHRCFGADTVVVTSASAKTALFTAHFLHQPGGPRIVGLTSSGHLDFVRGTHAYDEVLAYADVADLTGDGAVLLDYGSNLDVRSAVTAHYGPSLVKNFAMGLSHAPDLERLLDTSSLAGPAPEMFPAQLAVTTRRRELGGEEYDRRTAAALAAARSWSDGWLTITEHHGAGAVADVYRSLLDGSVAPDTGHVLLPQ